MQEIVTAGARRVSVGGALTWTAVAAAESMRDGGDFSLEGSLALLLDSAIRAGDRPASPREKAVRTLLSSLPVDRDVRDKAAQRMADETADWRAKGRLGRPGPAELPRFRVERPSRAEPTQEIPVRVSYWQEDPLVKVAAISQTATVPERVLRVDLRLIDELVERMTAPCQAEVDRLSALLSRLLVPHEFRDVLTTGSPLVFEVDRQMARVHWELLTSWFRSGAVPELVALKTPVARQLRTTYSPAPTPTRPPGRELRALVVGDPGDPAAGHALPGARQEALAMYELLRSRNVEVTARIGAPSAPRDGLPREIEPADRLDVLALLLEERFDIVHYAGHGDFDPVRPDRVGWVFASGLLTPGELERVEQVPAIVVANACLTARTSTTTAGTTDAAGRSEAALLPSLADEFFRLGVRNYVGTSWEVNDIGAQVFARELYHNLLPQAGAAGPSPSFGRAVLAARRALADQAARFGPLWAAYQHYGDPTTEAQLVDDESV